MVFHLERDTDSIGVPGLLVFQTRLYPLFCVVLKGNQKESPSFGGPKQRHTQTRKEKFSHTLKNHWIGALSLVLGTVVPGAGPPQFLWGPPGWLVVPVLI